MTLRPIAYTVSLQLPRTVDRHYFDTAQMIDTLESQGEVTTHLSVMGMTTVKGA